MLLKGARILNDRFEFAEDDILIRGRQIEKIGQNLHDESSSMNLDGMMIVPGLVDLHIHGCAGADACDATKESLNKISKYLAFNGTTSFLPTLASLEADQLEQAVSSIAANAKSCMGARVLGINLEGPFLNSEKAGAQNANTFRKPDVSYAEQINAMAHGMVKIINIAPEVEGALGFINAVSDKFRISLAHTAADYMTALSAFQNGATQVTHLYNGMSGMTHREPGVVGAVFDCADKPSAELICDLHHVHPAVIRTTFKLLGGSRVILISDCMRAGGMPDGEYMLGEVSVCVKDGVARTKDGKLAGSTASLLDCVRNLVSCGLPLEMAIRSATITPARALGMEREIGSIAEQKQADLVVLDDKLNVKMVIIGGKIFNRGLAAKVTIPE